MRWQTGARIGVAIVGVSVAITVFAMSRRGAPPPQLPKDPPKLDPNVSLLGGNGQVLQYQKGKASLSVTFSESKTYDDGRMRFEHPTIKGLGDNSFTLKAGVLETKGPIAEAGADAKFELTGKFTFESTDGLVVESERGSYDNGTGVLSMPDAVTFRRGRINGTSTGATFDRTKDTVIFLDAVSAHVAPDAQGKGTADATAKRMTLVRAQHSLQMEENARIAGDTQILAGRNATVLFTDDETAMKYLELRGDAHVTPVAGATSSASGQPTMAADNLTMSFYPDGSTMQHATLTGRSSLSTTDATGTRAIQASWIDLFMAKDGTTLTRIQARDKVVVEIPATPTAAGRVISSSTLDATGDEKRGLTSARFEGSPCFQEVPAATPATKGRAAAPIDRSACTRDPRAQTKRGSGGDATSTRTGTATLLVLTLAGQLNAIEKAEFRQDARFDDGRVTATADLATYDDAKDALYLRPNERAPRHDSHVTSADMTVDAVEIDVYLETENLDARDHVKTRSVGASGQDRGAGSLFEGDEPIYGTAAQLRYVKDTGKATYTGSTGSPARLQQGKTDILAAEIEFTQSTSNLKATGKVDSTIFMTAPAGKGKAAGEPTSYKVQSETLTYDDARRLADYQGTQVTLRTDDGQTEANSMTFELAKDSRTLQRMRAEGRNGHDVFSTLSGGYEALGALIIYNADSDVYSITGKPARIKAPNDGAAGSNGKCKFTSSLTLNLIRATGAVEFPGETMAQSSTVYDDCSKSLRSQKK